MSAKPMTTVQQSYIRHLSGRGRTRGLGAAAAPRPDKLSYGDCGTGVTELQDFFRLIGFDLDSNGMFDEAMVEAVTKFQAKVGLTPTGVADEKTQNVLEKMARDAFEVQEKAKAHAEAQPAELVNRDFTALSPLPGKEAQQAIASADAQVSGPGPTSAPLETGGGNGDTGVGYSTQKQTATRGKVRAISPDGSTDANGVMHVDVEKLVQVGAEATPPAPQKAPSTFVMVGLGVVALGLVFWVQSRAKLGPPRPDTSDLRGLVARRNADHRAVRRSKQKKQEA